MGTQAPLHTGTISPIASFAHNAELARIKAVQYAAVAQLESLNGQSISASRSKDEQCALNVNRQRLHIAVDQLLAIKQDIWASCDRAAWLELECDMVVKAMDSIALGILKGKKSPDRELTEKEKKVERRVVMGKQKPNDKAFVNVPEPETAIAAKADDVAAMIDELCEIDLGSEAPALTIDLEGHDHGRHGGLTHLNVRTTFTSRCSNCLLFSQIYCPQLEKIYIVDVSLLGSAAFSTTGTTSKPTTLKQILEDTEVGKLVWDCRTDNDAIFNQHGVFLGGIRDVQLMDVITGKSAKDRKTVKGISRAISQRMRMREEDHNAFRSIQDWGRAWMTFGNAATEKLYSATNGDYRAKNGANHQVQAVRDGTMTFELSAKEIFQERPMSDLFIKYCVADLVLLPAFYEYLIKHRFWNENLAEMVREETAKRLALARRSDEEYNDAIAQGIKPNLAPEAWASLKHVERAGELVRPEAEGEKGVTVRAAEEAQMGTKLIHVDDIDQQLMEALVGVSLSA
ncbi:3 -5 exonuclease protein [Teratosphaeria destructans]|uniref:3 -5 exonuclease protein n=1 Tax=Teratosphaeria destructans TaxID=418781 RepID=A0A9W7W749_9PEZI|nr:3 -5 exonuclease protein [Teratosphaeria destructans]